MSPLTANEYESALSVKARTFNMLTKITLANKCISPERCNRFKVHARHEVYGLVAYEDFDQFEIIQPRIFLPDCGCLVESQEHDNRIVNELNTPKLCQFSNRNMQVRIYQDT